MDFTARLPAIQASISQRYGSLEGRRVVLGFGGRALLLAQACNPAWPHRVVGAATTEAELLTLVRRERPDLLFCGDRLEAGDPIALVEAVHSSSGPTRVLLLLSGAGHAARAERAIRAGCDGLLVEEHLGEGTLVGAVHALCGGGVYVDRSLAAAYRHLRDTGSSPPSAPLTVREREVLQLVAAGTGNNAIASRLIVSRETVKTHLANLSRKLNARDRTHAAVIGLKLGWIDYPES
jgi:DNA-binding NarL/FixJ family response regulator